MAKNWMLTRQQAELLIDLIEQSGSDDGHLLDAVSELRELFGLLPQPLPADYLYLGSQWDAEAVEIMRNQRQAPLAFNRIRLSKR